MDSDWMDAAVSICLDMLSLVSACVPRRLEILPIEEIISFMEWINRSKLRLITAISSCPLLLTVTVKSPSVIAVMTAVSFFTGLITTCVTRSMTRHKTKMDTPLIIAIIIRSRSKSAKTTFLGT